MKERPILFSAPMIRAILDGSKSQTRRIIKPAPPSECSIHHMLGDESWLPEGDRAPLRHTWEAWGGDLFRNKPDNHLCGLHTVKCPFGKPGDKLWVRENMALHGFGKPIAPQPQVNPAGVRIWSYAADEIMVGRHGRVTPSIFMPRWASRITLEIVSVRVERLHEIGVEDAEDEGCKAPLERVMRMGYAASPSLFRELWDSLNAARGYGWDANPWVWAVKFRRITDEVK